MIQDKSLFKCMIIAGLLITGKAEAQLLTVGSSADMTILSGTVFKVDSLILTPSADFSISNNSINKAATVVHLTSNPYISRVYRFNSTTNPYNGSVQMFYREGAELNGIPESQLTLNIHNNSSWSFYPATTRDAANNFVLTNGVSSTGLNELTLASSAALPLSWLSFTATKQNQTALLKWATTLERNTSSFTVQHSENGINWGAIGILPAAGFSNTTSNYSYVHTSPINGINYYRILQADMDNRSNYSEIRTLNFTASDESFIIIGNPVTNNVLTVQVSDATNLSLYTADGKFLWQQHLSAGTTTVDVSRYAKGTYLLRTNSTVQKVVIQ